VEVEGPLATPVAVTAESLVLAAPSPRDYARWTLVLRVLAVLLLLLLYLEGHGWAGSQLP
jgi:hypothetical protein